MAQEGPTFIDKHIEKVVLGIAVVVLAYCSLTWGINTPCQIKVGNKQYKPEQVDKVILARAEKLKKAVADNKYDIGAPVRYMDKLEYWQKIPLAVAVWGPVTDPETKEPKLVRRGYSRTVLASVNVAKPYANGLLPTIRKSVRKTNPQAIQDAMSKPSTPQIKCGLVTTIVPGPGGDEIRESIRATTGAIFDVAALKLAWTKALDKTVADASQPVPFKYEIEYQVRVPGEEWVTVQLPATRSDGIGSDGKPYEPPVVPAYTGDNASAVYEAMDHHVGDGGVARWLVQPKDYSVLADGQKLTWEQALFPWQLLDEYSKETAKPDSSTGAPNTSKAPSASAPGTSRSAPAGGDEFGDEGEDEMAGADGFDDGMSVVSETFTAEKRTLPDFKTQITHNRLLLWAHVDNLKFGREYRVRYRMIYFSPLLTMDEAVEQPEMAKVQLLTSPWSDWSEAAGVERKMEYYVTGFSPVGNKAVTVTVFTQKFGTWVKAEFEKLAPGSMIGGEKMVQVFNPLLKAKVDCLVDFSTGAMLLELKDRQEYFRDGKKQSSGVATTIQTADGKLIRRVKNIDTEKSEYKRLKDETNTVPRRTRAPADEFGSEGDEFGG